MMSFSGPTTDMLLYKLGLYAHLDSNWNISWLQSSSIDNEDW